MVEHLKEQIIIETTYLMTKQEVTLKQRSMPKDLKGA